jgi:hypothetical protein
MRAQMNPLPAVSGTVAPGFEPVRERFAANFHREDHCREVGAALSVFHGERCVVVAPASITLQGLIHLRRRTGHPVLLADAGRILGVAGDAEIIAALSARRATGGNP